MDSHLKNLCTAFVVAVILTLTLTQTPIAHSEQMTVQQKSQEFLINVAGLDLAKYNVHVQVVDYPTLDLFSKAVIYNLTSIGTQLNVVCLFRNDNLVWCKLYPIQGSPLFTQVPSSAPLNAAKNLLNSYQNFSAEKYLSPMGNMLTKAAQLTNITSNLDNVVQQTSIKGNTVSIVMNTTSSTSSISQAVSITGNNGDIEWTSPVNGIENDYNILRITVQNGSFEFLCDNWNLYKVGNANVNVQNAEAVQIALEQARNYSWAVGNETVSNFTVLDGPVLSVLSMNDRGNYTLYPYWNILLPLDKVYPGGVNSIRVLVWADTGQIASIIPLGGGGPPPQIEQSTAASSSSVSSNSPSLIGDYVIVAALIAIIVVSGCLLYKRRR